MRPIIPALRPITDGLAEPAYALTRFVAGAFLVPHGAWKLFSITGGTHAGMVAYFASLDLQPAEFLVDLVGVVEFFGGCLIALGLFSRPAAALAVISTGTAAFYVHLPLGFYVDDGGTEFATLWTAVLLLIAIRGSGTISLDRWFGREI